MFYIINSKTKAKFILRCLFGICAAPLVLMPVFQLFFHEALLKAADGELTYILAAYCFWFTVAILGWLTLKGYLWSTYLLILIYIAIKACDVLILGSTLNINFYEIVLISLMITAIRSIYFIKGQSCANE